MKTFSNLHGFKQVIKVIQIDSIDDDLRNKFKWKENCTLLAI